MVLAWEAVVVNSLHDEEEEVDPAQPKHGWQSKATWVAGPMASAAFIAILSLKETRTHPQPFRLLF